MASQTFSEQKCNLCKMLVSNIKVHMKLNHKKKKNKYYGFESQSTLNHDRNSSVEANPSLPNYSRQAEIHKSEQYDKVKKPKAADEKISLKLSMIGDQVQNEVLNSISAFQENSIDLTDEDRIALLGLNSMTNVFKKSINSLKVEECPECKGLFHVNGKVATREFRDHLGICGLNNDRRKNQSKDIFRIKKENVELDVLKIEAENFNIKEEILHEEETINIKEESMDDPYELIPTRIKEEIIEPEVETPLLHHDDPMADVIQPDILKDSILGRVGAIHPIPMLKPGDLITIQNHDTIVEIKEEPTMI